MSNRQDKTKGDNPSTHCLYEMSHEILTDFPFAELILMFSIVAMDTCLLRIV